MVILKLSLLLLERYRCVMQHYIYCVPYSQHSHLHGNPISDICHNLWVYTYQLQMVRTQISSSDNEWRPVLIHKFTIQFLMMMFVYLPTVTAWLIIQELYWVNEFIAFFLSRIWLYDFQLLCSSAVVQETVSMVRFLRYIGWCTASV